MTAADGGERTAGRRRTRRACLRALCATAALTAGCGSTSSSSPPSASRSPSASRTARGRSTRGRNVAEAGADDTGATAINRVLRRVHDDGVDLYFPPGRYRLDPLTLRGRNWSLIGEDATIVVPGDVDDQFLFFDGAGWTVDGFTIDLSADGAAPTTYLQGRNWAFRNVRFVGQMDDPQSRDSSSLLYPAVETSNATGLIENVSAMDGSADPGESSNRGLTWFGPNNEGTLTWRGCQFSKWANNTLYAAESAGPVVIEDCLFRNTNVGVRIAGHTTVRNCLWVQDGRVPIQRWSGDTGARGLWLNSNGHTHGPISIRNCDFVMTGPDAHAAVYASDPVDDVEIRNTRVHQTSEWPAVELPGTGRTTIRNVQVRKNARGAAIDLTDRDDSLIADVCIRKPGPGIRIESSANCQVESSTLDVGGKPFVFVDSDVTTRDISRSGTCRAPDRTNPATQ